MHLLRFITKITTEGLRVVKVYAPDADEQERNSLMLAALPLAEDALDKFMASTLMDVSVDDIKEMDINFFPIYIKALDHPSLEALQKTSKG